MLLVAPPYNHSNRVATHLLTGLLGTGYSSRLFRRLREDTGLVYDVHADYQAYAEAGMLVIEGATRPDRAEQAVDITLDTWNRLASGQEPVEEEELIGAKNRLRSQHMISSGDVYTRMCRLATQELYFGHALDTEDIQEKILTATAEDVQHEAWRLGAENPSQPMHIAVAGPPLSGAA